MTVTLDNNFTHIHHVYLLGFAKTRKIQTRVLPDKNFKTRVGLGYLQ